MSSKTLIWCFITPSNSRGGESADYINNEFRQSYKKIFILQKQNGEFFFYCLCFFVDLVGIFYMGYGMRCLISV